MNEPCRCEECVRAGCDRPPVRLAVSHFHNRPERVLHGIELAKYWREVDERKRVFTRLVDRVTKGKFSAHQRSDTE